jgi:Xaa-Pro aminopeptidase
MAIQDFGETYSVETFFRARDIARDLVYELSTLIHPGMSEDEAHQFYKNLCLKYDIKKNWHPPKIRFGPNTLKAFSEVSEPYLLKDEDIFFIDIGPIVEGHEADIGVTFNAGSNFEHKKIIDATQKVYEATALLWKQTQLSGPKLYELASNEANKLGYQLDLRSDGHRIGDFPHQLFFKGGVPDCEEPLRANAWILEIHLKSLNGNYGAFFEDVLT